MNVLIIDDEPLAVELLESYTARVSAFRLCGKSYSAAEAMVELNNEKIDVIFLDINMPDVSGLAFLKMLRNPPYVIFTTAYSEYAAESYEYNVVDYLVKPITFERFLKATHKLLGSIAPQNNYREFENNILFVRSDGKMIKVDIEELAIIEGYKNYVRLWVNDEKLVVHNTMKSFEEYLQADKKFLRVHKSFIVNINHISEVSGASVKLKSENIAIGASYRQEVQAALQKYRQL